MNMFTSLKLKRSCNDSLWGKTLRCQRASSVYDYSIIPSSSMAPSFCPFSSIINLKLDVVYSKMNQLGPWFPMWRNCLWLLFVVLNIAWSCSPRSASAAALHGFTQCTTIMNCPPEQYCNFNTKSCVNCTDCAKYKRLAPLGTDGFICAKGKEECGPCQPGFIDDGDHCSFESDDDWKARQKPEYNTDNETEGSGLRIILIVALLVATPLLIVCLTCVFKKFYKTGAVGASNQLAQESEMRLVVGVEKSFEEKERFEASERRGGTPEEYSPPPPYNLNFTPPEKMGLVRALPTDFGRFRSENIQFQAEDNDAVVPEMASNDSGGIGVGHLSNLADEGLESSVLDLNEWYGAPLSFLADVPPPVQNGNQTTPVRNSERIARLPRTSTQVVAPVAVVEVVNESDNGDHPRPIGRVEESVNFGSPINIAPLPQPGPNNENDDSGFMNDPGFIDYLVRVDLRARFAVVSPNHAAQHWNPANHYAPDADFDHPPSHSLSDWTSSTFPDLSQVENADLVVDSGVEEDNGENRMVPDPDNEVVEEPSDENMEMDMDI